MSKNKPTSPNKNLYSPLKPSASRAVEPPEVSVVISPNDPVFFRDGKPFTMGEEVHTTGIFPPYPSVLQGALRSAYFARNPSEIPSRNQPDKTDKTAQAEFSHTLLLYHDDTRTDLLFPFPADVLMNGEKVNPLQLIERSDNLFLSSQGHVHSCFLQSSSPEKAKSTEHIYLTHSGMVHYLAGKPITEDHWIDLKEGILINGQRVPLLHEESRIGIGRDAYGVTQEGRLYRMTRRRMNPNLHFFLICKNLKMPSQGKLALGSEGVSGQYDTSIKTPPLPACGLNYRDKDTIYKLYVQSPAIVQFEPPYLPPCLRVEDIDLLTYAMSRPAAVGGWDMKLNAPRALRYAIPAGAVYYFRAKSKAAFDAIKALHGQSICTGDYQRQGFGMVLLGIYKSQNV